MKQMESAEPWLPALTSPPGETPHVITEVYSPPRVTACAKSLPGFGVVPGLAFDLTSVDETVWPRISTSHRGVTKLEGASQSRSLCSSSAARCAQRSATGRSSMHFGAIPQWSPANGTRPWCICSSSASCTESRWRPAASSCTNIQPPQAPGRSVALRKSWSSLESRGRWETSASTARDPTEALRSRSPQAGFRIARRSCMSCPRGAEGRMACAVTHGVKPTKCARGGLLQRRPYTP